MNVETGTEAAQFPEKEYISGIFVAVHVSQSVVAKIAILWTGIDPGPACAAGWWLTASAVPTMHAVSTRQQSQP